jgi:hypothetical protein
LELSEELVAKTVIEALRDPLEPPIDTAVPKTLVPEEQLQAKVQITQPKWTASESMNGLGIDIVQKKLSNGLAVNLVSLNAEPNRANMRLYVPGGRMLESRDKPGSVLIGARTIQEGGAFLSMTREEVELFCIDHLVMVDIIALEDALVFDFQTVTTLGKMRLPSRLDKHAWGCLSINICIYMQKFVCGSMLLQSHHVDMMPTH